MFSLPRFLFTLQVQLQDVPRDLISLVDLEGEPDPNPDIRNAEEEENKRIQPANEFYDGENDNDRDVSGANIDDLSVGASSKSIPGNQIAVASAQHRSVGPSSAAVAAAEAAVISTPTSTHAVGETTEANASADSSNKDPSNEHSKPV